LSSNTSGAKTNKQINKIESHWTCTFPPEWQVILIFCTAYILCFGWDLETKTVRKLYFKAIEK
jgi:hypothetical protein